MLIREMAHAVGVPRRFSWHVNENLQTVPKFTLCILCSNRLVSHLIGRFPAREDRSLISLLASTVIGHQVLCSDRF